MKTSMLLLLAPMFLTQSSSATDWIDIGKDKLYSFDGPASFWFANISCMSKGTSGRLADINSDSLSNTIARYARRSGESFWIGISKDASGEFKRTGGEQSRYFNWNTGEPNDYDDHEDCVAVFPFNMKWNDAPCATPTKNYLCSIDKAEITERSKNVTASDIIRNSELLPTPTDHEQDWLDISSDVLYSIEYAPASWYEAVWKCRIKEGINSRLASFDSVSYKPDLRPYIKNAAGSFWIGFHKNPSGALQRVGSVDSFSSDWTEGEPNNANGGKEDCVELYASSLKWNDADCDARRPYICASDKGNRRKTETSATDENFSAISKKLTTVEKISATTENLATVEKISATTENLATAEKVSILVESVPSPDITDIAMECNGIVIALTFFVVFVVLGFLVTILLRRRFSKTITKTQSFQLLM